MDVQVLNGISRVTKDDTSLSRVYVDLKEPEYILDGASLDRYSLNGYTLNGDDIDMIEEYCVECERAGINPTLNGFLNGRAERKRKRAARKKYREGKKTMRQEARAAKKKGKAGQKSRRQEAKTRRKEYRTEKKEARDIRKTQRQADRAAKQQARIAARKERKIARQLAREERSMRRAGMTEGLFKSAEKIGQGVLEQGGGEPSGGFVEDRLSDYVGTTLPDVVDEYTPEQVQDILMDEEQAQEKGLFGPPKLLKDPVKWFGSKKVPVWQKGLVIVGAAEIADQVFNKGNLTRKLMGKPAKK